MVIGPDNYLQLAVCYQLSRELGTAFTTNQENVPIGLQRGFFLPMGLPAIIMLHLMNSTSSIMMMLHFSRRTVATRNSGDHLYRYRRKEDCC